MDYLLDTNIILAYVRQSEFTKYLEEKYNPLNHPNTPIISVVSVGEIKSLAILNNWGSKKIAILESLLDIFLISEINANPIIERYAEIDAFSQRKLPNRPLNSSAIKMGKNDLWIAATTSVLNAKLLTTDKDFSHLKNEFLKADIIDSF